MKTIILSALLLLSFKSFSQVNLYAFSNGEFVSEKRVKEFITDGRKKLPATMDLQAIIYHKVIKPDTIVNYISRQLSLSIYRQPLSSGRQEQFLCNED